jgi:uncharacterized membrane protein YdjX (TVP38/TMEM64 family)
MSKSRRAFYFRITGLLAALAALMVLSRFFPLVDLIGDVQQRVIHWGAWSAIFYPLLFALCNILLLPGGILCVGAGFFFGLWWGFIVVFVGNGMAAAISFALSRSLAGRWFRQKYAQNPTLRALEPAVERDGWKIILLSQLHPLFPTSLLNYLYGLTRIPFRTYMFWTSIGRAPGLFLYAYLGTLGQYGLNLALGKTQPRAVEYWMWGGAFVIAALLLLLLTRIALRTMERSQVHRPAGSYAVGETAST